HAPYSNFYVGAAVLLQNGQILNGANQENAAYPMCLCAERVALASAHAQHPDSPVVAIAITVKNPAQVINQPAAPCGACRQVICETEQRYQQSMQIVLRGETGEIFVFEGGKDLLPIGFDQSYL
ncbi:MAG: cytidine deaminase, partial [Bacteroidota bacterium]